MSFNASNEAFVCTARPAWIGTGFVTGSCDAALSRLYITEVARYQDRMMEFTAPGASPGMPPPFFPTPRKYTAGERSTNTARGTSHLRFIDGEGSCVIAVLMLPDFNEENLPCAWRLDPALGSDLSTWDEIYPVASHLKSECVTRLDAIGWIVVGKKSDLRLKASKKRSLAFRYKQKDWLVALAFSPGRLIGT